MDDGERAARPTLRVISGDATPEEIAAILAVVAARGRAAAADGDEPAGASVWASPERARQDARTRHLPGPHGWRTSYWPH